MAGDGTTTATVLAHAILREGMKSVAAGMNPMDLKRGIEKAVAQVVEEIQKKAKKVKDTAEIAQVGTVAANGEKSIGQIRHQRLAFMHGADHMHFTQPVMGNFLLGQRQKVIAGDEPLNRPPIDSQYTRGPTPIAVDLSQYEFKVTALQFFHCRSIGSERRRRIIA
jgi:hypothetical protein